LSTADAKGSPDFDIKRERVVEGDFHMDAGYGGQCHERADNYKDADNPRLHTYGEESLN